MAALATGAPVQLERAFDHAAGLVEASAGAEPGRALAADGRIWHDAGATTGQMLALMLADLAEILRRLDARGVPPARTLASTDLRVAVDADIFTNIAALRALRRLFASLAAAAGVPDVRPLIHAFTAERMYTRYDPWTNMLRATAATLAAVTGGAGVITVLPFDHALGLPDRLSRRIARDTQLIARLESNLHRVIDPAGGAPYVKHLADGLARRAWELFREIEATGGLVAALERGHVQEMLARSREERERRIRTREELLVGVADFPDLAERRPQPRTPDLAALRARAQEAVARAEDLPGDFAGLLARAAAGATFRHTGPDPQVAPLPRVRLAEPFERLRDLAEVRRQRGAEVPEAAVFGIGRPRDYVDRSGFAKNLFEAGGFPAREIAPVAGPEEAARALREGGFAIAALAGADEALEREGAAFAAALRGAGARRVFLVGRPAVVPEGLDGVLRRGIDVVALLEDLWRAFGEEVAA
ncbi:Methylmalonyl-CoA mutase small subunit [bacterium HR39]|nr:Methylmalonyl-CoA mutase small subunit [bacterium HR39]